MARPRSQFLEDLEDSYSAYYDIHKGTEESKLPLAFRADFHSTGESYFLIKKAKIWTNETNEYVFVFSAPWFDADAVDECVQYALDTGLPLVKPHKEHYYSNIHAIFVADKVSPEIRSHIEKKKFSKSYKMSLHGFTLLETAYIDLSSDEYGTNKEGHTLNKFFKELLSKK